MYTLQNALFACLVYSQFHVTYILFVHVYWLAACKQLEISCHYCTYHGTSGVLA